ncbi:MAG: NADH-quinone oxidoreductase subunit J [Caldimicrobium sp.]|nr:NADH-quinone oxidoreductase subunit J [Caldimicrobium sp.]MCX7873400.1 NADH-quinone oxidoreductase subunit J [Caldimicrobium sp.]MDW8094378.1 NADH-quinone oxidoreductase subunit J [Caldimicrobium sp.]
MDLIKGLFLYFALVILFSAILGLKQRNPVKGLLWILLMFLHIGGLYLLLNAEFLAVVQIIVYVGAILVLYLIMLMILEVKEEERTMSFLSDWQARIWVTLVLTFFFLFGVLTYSPIHKKEPPSLEVEKLVEGKLLGRLLFEDYVYPLIILGFLLLVPLLGIGLIFARRK